MATKQQLEAMLSNPLLSPEQRVTVQGKIDQLNAPVVEVVLVPAPEVVTAETVKDEKYAYLDFLEMSSAASMLHDDEDCSAADEAINAKFPDREWDGPATRKAYRQHCAEADALRAASVYDSMTQARLNNPVRWNGELWTERDYEVMAGELRGEDFKARISWETIDGKPDKSQFTDDWKTVIKVLEKFTDPNAGNKPPAVVVPPVPVVVPVQEKKGPELTLALIRDKETAIARLQQARAQQDWDRAMYGVSDVD